MTGWMEARRARDAQWDEWAREMYGVDRWESLEEWQLILLVESHA